MNEKILDCCEENVTHENALEKARSGMVDIETLYDLSELFKMFGDSTRVSILSALMENELCVCDLAELLNVGASAVSHQLRLLRSAGLVRPRRDGKSVYYSLDDEHVHTIFHAGLEHVMHKKG